MEDFKAGQCDGLAVSTFRARQLNAFAGSVDAFGGLPEIRSLKALSSMLNRPQLTPHLVQGAYEVVACGIVARAGLVWWRGIARQSVHRLVRAVQAALIFLFGIRGVCPYGEKHK